MKLVEEVKSLCKRLGEDNLVEAIDRFMLLNQGLEKTRGEHFAKAGIYGFLEGILTTLRIRHEDHKIEELLIRVKEAREKEEIFLRKARPPISE
ncbi:DUF3216 domain-containing protein [Pyrococcus kukulkanii]|uniref:DUF3216 domain-containing protein n=1 Tax=Pyrococcus kukulkanii TaxID=1609559 RepID=A0A127B9M7_9EURY|nr:DUF3216 domain-containing protein [Pyrococcus kukulkanii]AMM54062.1 methyltransferase [Pyrococcus kukulkanii]